MPLRISELQIPVPSYFRCPISLELMRDPVSLCTGVTYDRASIEKWLDDGNNTCPATMQVLQSQELIPNHTLRRLIQEWCVLNRSKGVERIPTPQPPAEPHKVRSMLKEIASGSDTRLSLLKSLRNLAKGSERNRRCISEAQGIVAILVDLIGSAANVTDREVIEVSEEALSILVLFPLEEDTKRTLLATKLEPISWLLNKAFSIETRVNAASILESLAVDKSAMLSIGSTKGAVEGLIALLKDYLCPTAVKSGLKALLAICLPLRVRLKIIDMEAIPALVELLPGANRSTTEHVMGLLNALSCCAEGRAAITGHALAIPAIVRSMLVVSDITTEHSVEVLWSISRHSNDEKLLHELLKLGIFKNLLVLVQMDNNAPTKQRAKDLLRLVTEFHGDTACTYDEL